MNEQGSGEQQQPEHDRIAARAYELYLARGGDPEHDLDDWLAAEEQVRGAGEAHPPDPADPSSAVGAT